MHNWIRSTIAILALTAAAAPLAAQTTTSSPAPGNTPPAQNAAGGAQSAAAPDDPDMDPDALQPDFTLSALPTTLRLPRFKSAFRVTHRFTRPLGQGDFGDLASDLFGIDSGAQIGLEYRFGLMRGTQVGFYRTNDRTIQFFAEHNIWEERRDHLIGLSAFASIDGTNNFRDSYSPALGAIISRTLGPLGTVYVEPMWVNNTSPLPSALTDDNDSVILGLGGRIRVRPTVYLVGEVVPRLSGYAPGTAQGSIGLEKRAGGHSFQLTFSNSFGTTIGQVARGGRSGDDWYMGFSISRKFF